MRPQPSTAIDPYTNVPYFGGLVANATFGLANPSVGNPYLVSYDYGGRQELKNNFSVV